MTSAHAEMLKLLTLPSLRWTVILTLAGAGLLAYVQAPEPLFYCRAGFLALGALAAASEHQGGGQIRATLLAMPRRLGLQTVKVATLAVATLPIAAATAVVIDAGWLPGATASLVLTTLLAAALATVVRHAVTAMIVLVTASFVLVPAMRVPDGLAEVGWVSAGAVTIAAVIFHHRDA